MKANECKQVNKVELVNELVRKAEKYEMGCVLCDEEPCLMGFICWIGFEEWMDCVVAEWLTRTGSGDVEMDTYEYSEYNAGLIDAYITEAWEIWRM